MYETRFYRDWLKNSGLVNFEIKIFETDVLVFCDKMLKEEGERIIYEYRKELLNYMDKNSSFVGFKDARNQFGDNIHQLTFMDVPVKIMDVIVNNEAVVS